MWIREIYRSCYLICLCWLSYVYKDEKERVDDELGRPARGVATFWKLACFAGVSKSSFVRVDSVEVYRCMDGEDKGNALSNSFN